MSIQTRIRSAAVQTFIEWPAKRQTFGELAQKLGASKEQLEARFIEAEGTDKQRRTLRHIVGIERWGQRRLWLAIRFGGKSGVRSSDVVFSDAHHLYKPAESAAWDELIAKFSGTRQETVALAHYLEKTDVDEFLKVPHNDLGPLSLRGWLRYLQTHATLEGRRIR